MESIVELWDRSQQLEEQGNRADARAVYESILAQEPHHVPARLRMSRNEQLADRYLASRQHVLLAAESVASQAATRNIGFVTARLLDFAEEQRVSELILGASTSDPHIIRQSPVLAQHLWLAGYYKEALRFMDAIAKHVSVHPLLTFTRANVLRFLGDMDGAQREYEASIRMSPDLADAHWALATHSRSDPPRARIPRLQAALLRAKKDSVEQAHLCYALFREFDAADDVNEAWFSLTLGAHIMKQRLAYDSAQEQERLDAWMQVGPLETSSEDADAALVPIFVVGMPRTGTTLLDRMLGNHHDVESLGERNDFAAAVSESSDTFFRSTLHSDPARILERADFSRAGQLYIERLSRRARGVRFVIDKNPLNLFNVPLILRAVPAARIVCLSREPMDACFSNFKELFQGDAYPYSYAIHDLADHCVRAHRWMEHWQRVAPHAVKVVSYEALVADPEKSLTPVLDFIGLEQRRGLSDITTNESPVATASSSQVRENVHGRAVGAWQRYERQLQPLRERLGL